MTARVEMNPHVWKQARAHLDLEAEQVGFFLADWVPVTRTFRVREWKAVHDAEGGQRELHVSLSDEARTAVIKWAMVEDGCLIEAHSHGKWSPATFSAFDLRMLDEWVPHLWWRLRRRPYAALVTSHVDFDALAWIDGPRMPEQIDGIEADVLVAATRSTLRSGTTRSDG